MLNKEHCAVSDNENKIEKCNFYVSFVDISIDRENHILFSFIILLIIFQENVTLCQSVIKAKHKFFF